MLRDASELADEQRERLDTMPYWKSRKKLAKFAFEFAKQHASVEDLDLAYRASRGEPIAGVPPIGCDTEIRDAWRASWATRSNAEKATWLYIWAKKDRHLYQFECDERAHMLARRKDFYRNLARRLANRYEFITLEDWKLTVHTRLPKTEESADGTNPTARANMRLACLSELRLAITQAFGPARLLKVNPAGTTQRHHVCGNDMNFDAATQVIATCQSCGGITIDQDCNAGHNLLALGREHLGDSKGTGVARNMQSHEDAY
jgi:hypothetical protein